MGVTLIAETSSDSSASEDFYQDLQIIHSLASSSSYSESNRESRKDRFKTLKKLLAAHLLRKKEPKHNSFVFEQARSLTFLRSLATCLHLGTEQPPPKQSDSPPTFGDKEANSPESSNLETV